MKSDRIAAWLVLLTAGTTMVSYNLWHGFHSGMPGYLALLDGTVPVLLALGLSHMVARRGWFLKAVTIAVMLGAMVLSVRATGYGVSRATGNLWWLFGLVVDAAALVALQVILTPVPESAASTAAESALESMAGTVPESAGVPSQSPPPVPPRSPSEDPDAKHARTAYRKSMTDGRPLSEAALGAKFGKSRTWGRNRIAEVKAGPSTVAS